MSAALPLPLSRKTGLNWPLAAARPNAIALTAVVIGLLSLQWPFVVLHPNRVAPDGDELTVFGLGGMWAALIVSGWLLQALAVWLARGRVRAPALALSLAWAASASYAALTWGAVALSGDQEWARVAIAGGAWGTLAAVYIGAFALYAEAPRWLALPVLALAALAFAAPYQHLGVVMEYQMAADVFRDELLQHLLLVAVSLPPAMLLGAAIGLLAARKRALESVLLGAAGLLQTIPSIALFGLLLPIVGLGAKPAILAMVLYGLWPVVVNTHTGLGAVPPAMLDAARGVGMSAWQMFWRVELPLAAPFFVEGVRGAMLMLIGLATVAVLINAGGLGYFLLRGTEQAVPDLVLLGSLPVVALAFAADAVMRLLAWRLAPKGRVA
ncbi:osmoprotectant transport system permease protein [Duganella sacchari]|uniref:Osmoprotectant transport system permease protein n=1 Tax=Duganella sacchari TaxID=551987 RepID=A0A1M7IPK9_9BURK|nr:ABC transporter permease [Duganella sacchari]SHM42756.1 osmoprotectant transport system permease protein [Duganella sacchari]